MLCRVFDTPVLAEYTAISCLPYVHPWSRKKYRGKQILPGKSPTRMDLIPFPHFVAQLRGRRGHVVGFRSHVPDSGSGITAIRPLVHGVVALIV